jgi:hypothetical protein
MVLLMEIPLLTTHVFPEDIDVNRLFKFLFTLWLLLLGSLEHTIVIQPIQIYPLPESISFFLVGWLASGFLLICSH